MSRTDFPDDLASVLQAAADAAPPYHGDIDEVRDRGRTVRRRRTGAVAGLFVGALAAVLAIPVAIGQITTTTSPAEPTVEIPTDTGEPVWLLIAPPNRTGPSGGDPPTNYGELRPDGSTVELDLDLPGYSIPEDGREDVTALPGGRLAAVVTVLSAMEAELPASPPQVLPCEESVQGNALLVIEPDGSVGPSRELDRGAPCDGESVQLLAADAQNVYLRDGSQLVAHSLASGAERVLVDAPEFDVSGARASVAGGRIATVLPVEAEELGCEAPVRVTEIETGDTRDYRLPPAMCPWPVGPFQLSPDGRYAAAALYHVSRVDTDRSHSELRVVILDLDTGDIVMDHLVVGGEHESGGSTLDHHHINDTEGTIAGMTWDDERTLRVAWYAEPVEVERWMDAVTATELTVP